MGWYKAVTAGYAPDFFGGGPDHHDCQALRGHGDLADLILNLRRNHGGVVSSRWPEPSIVSESEPETDEGKTLRLPEARVPESDRNRALRLAWRVMTMCDVETRADHAVGNPSGEDGVWRALFPTRRHPSLEADSSEGVRIRAGLAADQLARVGGLKFKGTDELENHLKLDQERGEVLIFGWAAVLKEGLLAGLPRDDKPFDPLERNKWGAYLHRFDGQW